MIGFLSSVVLGLIMIPMLKRMHVGQKISIFVGENHKKKEGTPTMGGLIFILSTFFTTLCLLVTKKIELTNNLIIILLVFLGYALIGFLDDYLSVKKKNNIGLTTIQKLFLQLIVAVVFFYIYMKSGNDPVLEIYTLNIKIDMGWFYGIFILFVLLAGSNAVNLTDGLDGLAASLSLIAFLALGIIAWGSGWVSGYQDLAIFCFILVGSLFGFLLFNTYPAKVFMGDTGSLALGATLATLAILTDHELTLLFVMGVFVLETLSVIIQVISVKLFHKKVFLMTPLHHHFEKLGYAEPDIVKGFLVVGFLLAMAGIAFGVWI